MELKPEKLDEFLPIRGGDIRLFYYAAFFTFLALAIAPAIQFILEKGFEIGMLPCYLLACLALGPILIRSRERKWLLSYWRRNVVGYSVRYVPNSDDQPPERTVISNWKLRSERKFRGQESGLPTCVLVDLRGSRKDKLGSWEVSCETIGCDGGEGLIRLTKGKDSIALTPPEVIAFFDPMLCVSTRASELLGFEQAFFAEREGRRNAMAALQLALNLHLEVIAKIKQTRRFQHSKEAEAIRRFIGKSLVQFYSEDHPQREALESEYLENRRLN